MYCIDILRFNRKAKKGKKLGIYSGIDLIIQMTPEEEKELVVLRGLLVIIKY